MPIICTVCKRQLSMKNLENFVNEPDGWKCEKHADKTTKNFALMKEWEQILNVDDMKNKREGRVETLLLKEWRERGHKFFGKDMKEWRWKCPSCGNTQGYHDFEALIERGDLEKEFKIEEVVYFSCIGRFDKSIKAESMYAGKGPCNYTCGGLFKIGPINLLT